MNARSRQRMDQLARALVMFWAACTVLFLLVPLLVIAAMSLDPREYLGPFPPPGVSTQWFLAFFADDLLLRGLVNSVGLAAASTIAATLLGVPTALALHGRDFAGKDALVAFFLSPLMIPGVVLGFALLLFLGGLGIFDGWTRLLLGHLVLTFPYSVRATLAGMAGIPPSLREAALSLGSNEFQTFRYITFPLARTGITAGAIFAFACSMDEVAATMFLTDPDAYTLPVAMIASMRSKFDMTISAAAVVLVALTIALLVLLDRLVGLDSLAGKGMGAGRR